MSAPQAPYPHLFAPRQLGRRTMRNAIAFASIYSGRARGGRVTPELIRYYASRAAGGAGLIVTEPVIALRQSDVFGPFVNLYRNADMAGLGKWADAIHAHGTLLLAQLQDPGRGDVRPRRKPFSVAPSALPDDLSWSMPQALSVDGIAQVRDDFAAAATKLVRAGFDGVEISAGHGHLYHQFLSSRSNQRDDDFGGPLDNRLRALTELIDNIRGCCGPDFLIGVRLPANDGIAGGIDEEEAARIASLLTRTSPPDYVNFVHGTQAATLFMHVPDMHMERTPYAASTARLRGHCNGVPVASGGRLVEPAEAEAVLAMGMADFVMLGRPFVADAAWGLKALQGRDGDIRKCVSCNNCWGEVVHNGRPLACDNNPRLGRDELDWWPTPEKRRRRLVIVGGGIAGLEAGWVAAARGHHVILFCRSGEPGGKTRRHAGLPGCEAASSVFDFQLGAARSAGVELRTSFTAGLDDIVACQPDAVILATGGKLLWPTGWPEPWRELVPDLWSIIEELPRIRADQGTAVIHDLDGTDVTYAAAEALARLYSRVVLLTPVECISRDEALVKRQAAYHRLLHAGVEIIPWSEPRLDDGLAEGRLVVSSVLGGPERVIENVVLLAYAPPRAPDQALVAPLQAAGIAVHVIGEARAPRPAMAILQEAHLLGERIFAEDPNEEGNDNMRFNVAEAIALTQAALDAGQELGAPVAVAVVDGGGHIIAAARSDQAGPITLDVAVKKARTAANFRAPTHAVLEMVRGDDFQLSAVQAEPQLSVLPGGFPLMRDGQLVGAIGIAGGHYTQDQQVGERALLGFAEH